MKAIVFVILLISSSLAIAKSENKEKWYQCAKSNECIKVTAGCGRMESINKKFKSDQAKAIAKMAEKSSCLEPNEEELAADKEASASCVEKKCELAAPTAHAQK